MRLNHLQLNKRYKRQGPTSLTSFLLLEVEGLYLWFPGKPTYNKKEVKRGVGPLPCLLDSGVQKTRAVARHVNGQNLTVNEHERSECDWERLGSHIQKLAP